MTRVLVAFVPALVILIPSLRLIPAAYKWRLRLILYRWYRAMLALEREALVKGIAPPELDMELLKENDMVALLPEWRRIAESADSQQAELVSKGR